MVIIIIHTITAGLGGIGRVIDPIFRIYFSDDFRKEIDEHAQTEFAKLGALLLSES